VPVGIAPRRCSKGRFAGELPVPPGPPGRGVYCLPCPPGCIGRIGWPGRGPPPERCPLPGVVPGTGPRFPVGIGRDGMAGRAPGAPGAAAAGRAEEGCVTDGTPGRAGGRCALGAEAGCPVDDGGRIGIGAGGFVAGAGGATGLAAGGATVGVPTGGATGGFGTTGTIAGPAGNGAAAAAGATGRATDATGAATGAGVALGTTVGAGGFTATLALGAAATGAGGAAGRIRAALAAASFAAASTFAAVSAAASASACPKRFLRTFSATSSGIELECVFFSVTPYPGKRSIMALALTSSSRASSLIRTWFASLMRPMDRSTVKKLSRLCLGRAICYLRLRLFLCLSPVSRMFSRRRFFNCCLCCCFTFIGSLEGSFLRRCTLLRFCARFGTRSGRCTFCRRRFTLCRRRLAFC
jgi:hypothetical protein